MTRGKNDKVDARRIAEYAMRFLDGTKPYKRPTEELVRLPKQLEAERSLYLTDPGQIQGSAYRSGRFYGR